VKGSVAVAEVSGWRQNRRDAGRILLSLGPAGSGALLQLATFVLSARALGPEAFGLLAAVYAVSVIATDIAGLGGDAAMVRATALDPAAFPGAWGHALVLAAISWVPVVLVATVLAAWLSAPALAMTTVAALVAGEVTVGRTAAAAELAMIARGEPVRASLVRVVTAGSRTLVAVLLFGVLSSRSPSAWAAATFAQSMLVSGALLVAIRCLYAAPILALEREALVFGGLLMLNNLARTLSGAADRIVLAILLSPVQLGLYASGSRPLLLGGLLNQAVTRLYYPRFFVAAASGSRPLNVLTRRAGAVLALVGCLAFLLVSGLAQLLPVLLGPAFSEAATVGTLLATACPFIALQYPPADALTASGRQGLRTAIYLVATAAGAGLLALLAVLMGLGGAVLAFVVTQVALSAALWTAFLRGGR
jgi:O-antigen/teichoic acid export membrane protein